jgi:membrane protein EpsK
MKRHLGWSNYGMIVLANTFLSYVQVFTIAVTGSVGRFVTLHSSQKRYAEANSFLSTQVVVTAVLVAVMVPVAAAIAYFAPAHLRLPPGQETNTQILIFLVFASFLIALVGSIYRTTVFVSQRFDIGNYLEIINQTVRYSAWIVLFALFSPRIWAAGVGYVVGTTVLLVGTMIVFRKLTPQMQAHFGGFSRDKLIEMLKMGSWMSLAQVGQMLYIAVDALIIDKMSGPASVGKYGVVAMINVQVQQLAGNMMFLLFTPAIACYARQEWAQLMTHTARAIKFFSLGLAIGLGIVCGLAAPFMTRWMGPAVLHAFGRDIPLYVLMWVMLPHLVLNLGMSQIYAITYATNRMLAPGIATIGGGIVKLTLALTLVHYTNWGVFALAIADVIAVSLRNLIFAPLYGGHIMKGSSLKIYAALVPSIFIFTATAATGWQLSRMYDLATVPKLLAVGAALAVVYGLVTYFLALNRDDKRLLRQILPLGRKA